MRSVSTILQIALELDCFQAAITNRDTEIINEYLSMLFVDYDPGDINFVLAIIGDWKLEAIDFLTAAFHPKFQFMDFKIFEENDIKELLQYYAKEVLKQLNIIA